MEIHTLKLDQKTRIHAISTGSVAVKKNFKTKKGWGPFSKINIFLDPNFTPFLPIYVYVIEHPEGVIVIDTGENAKVTQPGYFNEARGIQKKLNTKHLKFEVAPDEEIGAQLDALGIREKVRVVVLTHLHLDHTDGLKDFPDVPILVNRLEANRPYGAADYLYPDWFSPILYDLKDQSPFEQFEHVHYLTEAKDIFTVSTPGHTRGHSSVIFKFGDRLFFFAGDVSYSQPQLLLEELSGAHENYRLARKSMKKIKDLANQYPLIYLPSHDPLAGERLTKLQDIGGHF